MSSGSKELPMKKSKPSADFVKAGRYSLQLFSSDFAIECDSDRSQFQLVLTDPLCSIPTNLQSSIAGFLRSIPSDATKTAAPETTVKTPGAPAESRGRNEEVLATLTGETSTLVKTATKDAREPEAAEMSTKHTPSSSHVQAQSTQTPVDLPLGWPLPVWVNEEIPRCPHTQARPAPVEPKLTGMVIGETVIDEVSDAEKFQATAG